MENNLCAIIVAGGKGSRMKSEIPKQFLELSGKPVLMHCLQAFFDFSSSMQLVLVLPESSISYWNNLCLSYKFEIPHKIQSGGDTRFQSVKKGLELLPEDGLVAIHDGVRPLINQAIIASSFNMAKNTGSAVASVKLKESIRIIENDNSKALDRDDYRSIQTPQTFKIPLIKKAYAVSEQKAFTDDASVVEAFGYPISLFTGNYQNIKITTPEDLLIAESLIRFMQ